MKTRENWRQYFLDLQKEDVLKHISRTEASLLLLVLGDVPESSAVCDMLTAKVRGESWEWTNHEELCNVALAILAVYNYRSSEINGTCLAYLTNRMLEAESAVGGPYYDSKQKVDIPTNFAISRLFNTLGSPLPNVEAFLLKEHSPPLSLEDRPAVVSALLLNWPRIDFTEEMTAEAARIMPHFAQVLAYKIASKSVDAVATPLHKIVSERVHEELKTIDTPLRAHAISAWKMVSRADINYEITMLPAYFAGSLKSRSRLLSQKLYIDLGSANFFMWMAYTIYDDFIDEEGQANLLPIANTALRKSLRIYTAISQDNPKGLQGIFETFDKMDAANSWELARCRYQVAGNKIHIGQLPTYSDFSVLANRAGGHVLGPLLIAHMLKVSVIQQQDIKKGLEQFLIAKQLSDDLQDWRDDLQRGHVSPVVAHCLKSMKVMPGEYDLPDLTRHMQQFFWATGMKEMNDVILRHLARSRRYFNKSTYLNLDGEFFVNIFAPLEEAARSNELQYIHHQQFLATYSGDTEKSSSD